MVNGMSILLVWFFLAFIVERIVELVLKLLPVLDHTKLIGIDTPMFLSLLISLVLAFGANLDFFQMFHIDFGWLYIGPVVSAILMMGGSNLVHDIIDWISSAKQNAKIE